MPLDEADKKFVTDSIANAMKDALKPETIGEAARAHLKAGIDGLKLDEKFKALTDAVAEIKAKADAGGGDGGGGEGAGKGKGKDGGDSETAKQLAGLQKKLDESAVREQQRERQLKDAEEARRREQMEAAARDALAKAGVPADRLKGALAVLKADAVFDFDKDGKPGWKGKDKYDVPTLLSLEDGAKAWIATDEGKHYLPPTGANGDGGKGGDRDGKPGGTAKLSDLKGAGGLLAALDALPG